MTRKPVIIDPQQANLSKIDREIERIEKQIAEKRTAVEADQAKHPLDQNEEMQRRVEAQIRTLRGHVDKLHADRFTVEVGDVAEPKRQPAPAAAKQHREWDMEPVQVPDLPGPRKIKRRSRRRTHASWQASLTTSYWA